MIIEVRTRNVTVVGLTLSIDEAAWLKDVMQNPLHGKGFDDEDNADRQIREALFSALDENI